MKHYIYEPAASVALGEPATVTGLETNVINQRVNNGLPFSRVSCLGGCLGGEHVTVNVLGSIGAVTPEQVSMLTRKQEFLRAKFTGLLIEVKGDGFNSVTYSGTAEKVDFINLTQVAAK